MDEIMPIKINHNSYKKWNYKDSVEKVKIFYVNWQKVTKEMLEELDTARRTLSRRGNPYRLKENGKEKIRTWNDYCIDVGLNRRTVNRWLDRYNNPEREIQTPIKEKTIENVLVESIVKTKDGTLKIRFICPLCEKKHVMEVKP